MKTPFSKKAIARAVGGALMAGGAALLVVGAFSPSAMAVGIADTKHNLGASGTQDVHLDGTATPSTTQICVFCHTPHGANTSVQAPLWNKAVQTNPKTYQTYDQLGTSTLKGTVDAVGSVSLACLSCHDGTMALNVMINAPGSGGYTQGGATFGTMMGNDVDPATGKLISGIITNIGTDLRNDHPVGIEYGGGLTASGGTTINLPDDFHAVSSTTVNGQQVWWVDTNGDGIREKTDINLYTRTVDSGARAGATEPFVECASCHDPHTTNVTFLRVANTGSQLCLSCHIK